MVTTGGFGAFPNNPISIMFQQEIGKNFPRPFLDPVNSYFENISAPTIEPAYASQSDTKGIDPVGVLINIFSANTNVPTAQALDLTKAFEDALTLVAGTQTRSAELATASVTSSPIPITNLRTGTPSVTATDLRSSTSTTQPTQTFVPVIIPRTTTPQPTDVDTPIPTNTRTPTLTATNIFTSTPTLTATNTLTPSLTPTNTITYTPSLTPTFTLTSTPTLTPTNTPTPAGHTISSFSLNGGGNGVTVAGGSLVTVNYNYQVWGNSSTCLGCNYQLVWGLENSWKYCSAWTSPSPGNYPGQTGTGTQFTITAPATTGTYIIYSFSGQYADCTTALAAYMSAGGTAQGTITVP